VGGSCTAAHANRRHRDALYGLYVTRDTHAHTHTRAHTHTHTRTHTHTHTHARDTHAHTHTTNAPFSICLVCVRVLTAPHPLSQTHFTALQTFCGTDALQRPSWAASYGCPFTTSRSSTFSGRLAIRALRTRPQDSLPAPSSRRVLRTRSSCSSAHLPFYFFSRIRGG
jgi:hypothetical protein